jgi:isopentenyl-diphosphate delta-isomerase
VFISLSSRRLEIEERKNDGIQIPINEDVQARKRTTLLEDVFLIHNALPELNFEDLDTSTLFLNHRFNSPILIDAMTGGTREAEKINENLAIVTEELGIGMGLGSQRAGLKSKRIARTYAIARKKAPNGYLIANIGASQLVEGLEFSNINEIIDMVKADAIAIHLNPLQELVQPEGQPHFKGVLDVISKISSEFSLPVIVKEVGCGISREVAAKLDLAGVSAINVAGVGGTSWAAIEHFRARKRNMKNKSDLGLLFWDWGIPTAASIIEVSKTTNLPIISSGGIRNGIEIAKCLVLGSSIIGLAYPLLSLAIKSDKDIRTFLEKIIFELKSTIFITPSKNIQHLSKAPHLISGALLDWKNS